MGNVIVLVADVFMECAPLMANVKMGVLTGGTEQNVIFHVLKNVRNATPVIRVLAVYTDLHGIKTNVSLRARTVSISYVQRLGFAIKVVKMDGLETNVLKNALKVVYPVGMVLIAINA